jgi:predicted permease
MGGLGSDIKFALIQATKNPGMVIVITIILGIGIGGNATIFSIVKAPLDFPVNEPTRLVTLWATNPERAIDRSPLSPGDFADLRMNLRSLESLAAFTDRAVHLTGGVEPLRATASPVTGNFFSVIGVEPVIGRSFSGGDAGLPLAILAFATWQSGFGGDRQVVGRDIEVDGVSHRIIGVMPRIGWLSSGVDLWLPMKDPSSSDSRAARELMALARVAPSAQVDYSLADPRPRVPQLQAELSALSKRLAETHPDDEGWEAVINGVIPMRSSEVVASNLLLIMPQFVLAIACANIANLLLARSAARKREIAVRIALGAGRTRIVRLLIVESIVYALAGASLGLVLGVWGTDLLRRVASNPLWETARVDFPVLMASVGVAILSGVVFGLAPALQTLRLGTSEALKQGGGHATIDRKGRRLRTVLMTGEVAVATLLLVIVGLGVRSALNLRALKLGFDVEPVQTFRFEVPQYRYADLDRVTQVHLNILEKLRALPGVEQVGLGTRVPTAGSRNNHVEPLTIEGRETAVGRNDDYAVDLTVSPGYFEALGIPLLKGRFVEPGDTVARPAVALVSRAMAERYWPGRDAVGQRVRLSRFGDAAPSIMIIGDVRNDNASAPPLPMLYLPLMQHPLRAAVYVVRTSSGMDTTATSIRTIIRSLEPSLPVFGFQTMSQVVHDDLAGSYLIVQLFAVFALLALFLATVGIFGVLSHITTERRPEIAIRMAVGALPRQVVRVFVWKGLRIALNGVFIGVIVGLGAARLIRSLLFNVSTTDPISFGLVIGGLLVVAGFACYLPARRATRLDPVSVLRSE